MKSKKYIYALLMGALASSCNFEEVNTNQYEVTPEMGKRDGAGVGAYFTSLESKVFTSGTQADGTTIANQYQTAYHLSADVWSGYFGQNNVWGGGTNHLTYFLKEEWCKSSYRNSYTEVLEAWRKIKAETEASNWPEAFALAQILKVASLHRTTDMFGPIPYTAIDKPSLVVPYDSQEVVYKAMLKDLDQAVEVLTPKAQQGAKVLAAYDVIYKGDLSKWVRLANSLMLRLAMRMRFVDEGNAKLYAERAVAHSLGLISDKEDEFKLAEALGLSFVNNLEIFSVQYYEARMGSSIFSYLVGYEDPRLMAYFRPSTAKNATEIPFARAKYQPIPTGHTFEQNEIFKTYSMPNIDKSTPTYLMRASEVFFLRAEGALIGWNMGGTGDAAAQRFYEDGVAMSFAENNINMPVTDYLGKEKTPIAYRDEAFNVNAPVPTKSTTKWTGANEQKLEKIATQKWLALYPNGQEAWSEWRRLGYPKLHKPLVNRSAGEISSEEGVRRLKYPTSELTGEDRANIDKAISLLGGPNTGGTKLWWDKK